MALPMAIAAAPDIGAQRRQKGGRAKRKSSRPAPDPRQCVDPASRTHVGRPQGLCLDAGVEYPETWELLKSSAAPRPFARGEKKPENCQAMLYLACGLVTYGAA